MLQRKSSEEQREAAQLRCEMGVWLRTLREEQGLTQRDLAKSLGLEYYSFISQLENGRGKIPRERYRDWAEALGQDTKTFVKKSLYFSDPAIYEILFEGEA